LRGRRDGGAGPRRLLNGRGAALGVGLHARLELGRALGRAARPGAQALDLARLREVQKRQDTQAENGRDASVRAVLLDLVL
jgi:hypothetical protein